MKVVFDPPMAACAVSEGCGRERPGGDIGSLFGLDLVAALDAALDHGDGGELGETGCARIGALRGVPVDDMGDRVRTSMRPWSLPTVSICSTSRDGAVWKSLLIW